MKITLNLDKCSRGYQISINTESHGYRIFGPKYMGDSVTIHKKELNERDAKEIKWYLDQICGD